MSEQCSQGVRVACASDNGRDVDGQFAGCEQFLIYRVTAEESELVEVRTAPVAGGGGRRDRENQARAELISDCHLLYCSAIGGPAAAKVVRAGVLPVKRADGGSAARQMAELTAVLAASPPPWLAKILTSGARPGLQAAPLAEV